MSQNAAGQQKCRQKKDKTEAEQDQRFPGSGISRVFCLLTGDSARMVPAGCVGCDLHTLVRGRSRTLATRRGGSQRRAGEIALTAKGSRVTLIKL